MKHLEIEIRNKEGDYIAGWGRLESIQDVKDCLFWRLNISDFALACKYLLYYNSDRASFIGADSYFEEYITPNRTLFVLESIDGKYSEIALIVEVDR